MPIALIREQLLSHFPEMEEDAKLLSECINICQNYSISGTELFYKWEAKRYSGLNPIVGSSRLVFNLAAADELKKSLVEELNKKRIKEQSTQNKRAELSRTLLGNRQNVRGGAKPGIVGIPAQSVAKSPAAPSVTFKHPTDDRTTAKYRYMYEKISERSEVLDERIDEFGELIRDHYNIDDLGDPSSTSEEDIVVVGRICNDAEASSTSSTKLTESSVFLESSRMSGSGSRVPLRFSPNMILRGSTQGAPGIGLFPGAIVSLKGKNGGGGFFVVEEIWGLPPLKLVSEPSGHRSFTMLVACGPYGTDADFDSKQFKALIEKAVHTKPSVLLLLGPFIDASHSLVKLGDVDQTPTEIFNRHFIEPLKAFLAAAPNSLILLEPSVKDVLSDHPVYPQCELDSPSSDPRIKMLPNPGRFSINDVTFASTSVDVLHHLRNQEYVQHAREEVEPIPLVSPDSSATDVLTNTCRHLLLQRSFYPLFPVPLDLSADVNLDISHFDDLRIDQASQEHAPDVLILPSRLKQFSKMVDATMAINPSFVTKGTFAYVTIPTCSREDLYKSIKCDILRL